MSTSTPIFSCQFWNIWVKQFGQFHFHSYIWYEMNEGLIILYWRQHLNLINLIDFRDQLNVALKTDYKYFLTINLKKIFGRYLPHEGGFWEKCNFQIFCSARANWPTHKISDFSDPPFMFFCELLYKYLKNMIKPKINHKLFRVWHHLKKVWMFLDHNWMCNKVLNLKFLMSPFSMGLNP